MNYYEITSCFVSLAIIAFVWRNGFAVLRRDNFRSDIRRIRDGLFDYVEEQLGV